MSCLSPNDSLLQFFFTQYLKREGHRLNDTADIVSIHKAKIQRLRDVMEGIKAGAIKFVEDLGSNPVEKAKGRGRKRQRGSRLN
jgi:hypothetical protein